MKGMVQLIRADVSMTLDTDTSVGARGVPVNYQHVKVEKKRKKCLLYLGYICCRYHCSNLHAGNSPSHRSRWLDTQHRIHAHSSIRNLLHHMCLYTGDMESFASFLRPNNDILTSRWRSWSSSITSD